MRSASRRIIACGRLGKWALVDEGAHPLPASARRHLEALWPPLEAADMTPAECEAWFAAKFENKETVKS